LLASSGRWRGLFVSRGSAESVLISRSGGQGSGAEAPLSGPSTITGPSVVTTTATSFDAPSCPVQGARRANPLIRPELEAQGEPLRMLMPFEDTAAQPAAGPAAAGPAMPAPSQNFEGLNYAAHGAGFPPDTN